MTTEFITDGKLKWINEEIKNKYNNSSFRVPLRNKYGIIIEYSLVDEEDFEKVNKYKWYNDKGYAGSTIKTNIKLHHFVYKKPSSNKNMIDHKDRDKLNNCKNNLHETSRSNNSQNVGKKISSKTTSKFIGVDFKKGKYYARSKGKHLGVFENEIDAALEYDKYVFRTFGEHASTNNLISYEDAIKENKNIETITKILPQNISLVKDKYYVIKLFNKIKYYSANNTLKEAVDNLQIINTKINRLKLYEELVYINSPIIRNSSGIAIIKANNKNVDILVDDKLWHKLNKFNWSSNELGYITNLKCGYMHRYILKVTSDQIVDHFNKKTYDNRIANLNPIDSSSNNHKKTKMKNTSSKYFGVSFRKDTNKWSAKIKKDYKEYRLGCFINEIDAAIAYNKKAIELYGKFANINII
jgi:hypothetical protein